VQKKVGTVLIIRTCLRIFNRSRKIYDTAVMSFLYEVFYLYSFNGKVIGSLNSSTCVFFVGGVVFLVVNDNRLFFLFLLLLIFFLDIRTRRRELRN